MTQTAVQITLGQSVQLTEKVGQFNVGTPGKVLAISELTCTVEVEDWENVPTDLRLTFSQIEPEVI